MLFAASAVKTRAGRFVNTAVNVAYHAQPHRISALFPRVSTAPYGGPSTHVLAITHVRPRSPARLHMVVIDGLETWLGHYDVKVLALERLSSNEIGT